MTAAMTEEPRPLELSRRIDDLRGETREGFRGVNARLDEVPTNALLILHMDKWSGELSTVRDDIKKVVAAHAHDVAAIDARLEEHRTDINKRLEEHKTDSAARRELDNAATAAQFAEQRKDTTSTRRYVITTMLVGSGAFVGLLTFILNQVAK